MQYDILVVQPLTEMMVKVTGLIPTLLTALVILIGGWLMAILLRRLIHDGLKLIKFDHFAEKIGVNRVLETGDIRRKPSALLGSLVYLVGMVMVLIMTVKALGFSMVSDLLDRILAYIPNVITGVLVLIIGMLVAKVVSGLIYVTAKNTDMPAADTLSRLSKLAIIAYVTIIFLKEIGFVSLFDGINYTIFLGGIVLALALAFGLAGRTVASRYLDVLKR